MARNSFFSPPKNFISQCVVTSRKTGEVVAVVASTPHVFVHGAELERRALAGEPAVQSPRTRTFLGVDTSCGVEYREYNSEDRECGYK